jgi:hypothetical protein
VAQRQRLTVKELISGLINYIDNELVITAEPYATDSGVASRKTVQRALKMTLDKSLIVDTASNRCIQLEQRLIGVQADEMEVENDVEQGGEDYVNYHRLDMVLSKLQRYELMDMPEEGWQVNADDWSCGCRIYLKDGSCVHTSAVKIANNVEQLYLVKPRNILINRRANSIRAGMITRARNANRARAAAYRNGRARAAPRGRGMNRGRGNAPRGRPRGARGIGNAYNQ